MLLGRRYFADTATSCRKFYQTHSYVFATLIASTQAKSKCHSTLFILKRKHFSKFQPNFIWRCIADGENQNKNIPGGVKSDQTSSWKDVAWTSHAHCKKSQILQPSMSSLRVFRPLTVFSLFSAKLSPPHSRTEVSKSCVCLVFFSKRASLRRYLLQAWLSGHKMRKELQLQEGGGGSGKEDEPQVAKGHIF